MATLLEIIFNPIIMLVLIAVILYVSMIMLVKTTGIPVFFRRMPIASRFFPVRIRVWEMRKNGYFPVDDAGRRFKHKNGKEIYQTLRYGDIMPPKISDINMAGSGNVVEFVMTEDGEFFPIVIDRVDETKFRYKPMTQEQKIFYRSQLDDSQIKYAKKQSFLDKLLPYLTLLIVGLIIVILIKITWDGMAATGTDISSGMQYLGEILQQVRGEIPALEQNFTY